MNILLIQIITGLNFAVDVIILFYILSNWGQPHMRYMAATAVIVTVNSLGCFLEKCSPTLEAAIIAYKIQYCAGNYLGAFILLFSLDYIGKPFRKSRLLLPLYIVPFCITLLVLIDPGFMAKEFNFVSVGTGGYLDIRQPRIPYHINYIYNGLLTLLGILVVVRQFVKTRKRGWEHNVFFAVVLMIPNIPKAFRWAGFLRELDFFFIACTLVLVIMYWYIMRFRQLEWRSLRWDTIMNKLTDAVLVINADKQIVKTNTTFY